MVRIPLRTLALAVCCLTVAFAGRTSQAAPKSETLLPDTTRGYLSVANAPELMDAWEKTQLSQLLSDPVMQPFAEDLERQFQEAWNGSRSELGLTWEDFRNVPSGEVAAALIHAPGEDPAAALLADVTGRQQETDALLDRITRTLLDRGAKRSTRTVAGTELTIFDLPGKPGEGIPPRKAIYFVRDNVLCATDNMSVSEGLLRRFNGQAADQLSNVPAFQSVMNRCRADAGQLAPHVRWFVEPIAYGEAVRVTKAVQRRLDEEQRASATDMLKVLKNQGFEAIRGVGGFLNFAQGHYEILHRTAIYAPPPYEKSMKMLVFPNGGDLSPQPWVPANVASYASIRVDVGNAFDNFGSLFDELFGEGEEGVWQDVLESLRDDPNGPGIDLRKDMIGYLGSRVTMITDYRLPITPTSERTLLAVDCTDDKALAEAVRKSMETDPEVVLRMLDGYEIWEIIGQEARVPGADIRARIELPGNGAIEIANEPVGDGRLLPRSAITVAHGHLFVASHVDFLREILDRRQATRSLSEMVDFQIVEAELDRLGAADPAARMFARVDDAFRPTYELLRMGKMPESQSMLGSLLNTAFGNNTDGPPREQRLDASQLPDFQVVRRYLGPAGTYMTSEPEGWFLVGFLLTKQNPPPVAVSADNR